MRILLKFNNLADLDVEIQLTQDQDRYKIIKWQEVTSKEWKNESTLPLLGSE